MEVWWIVYLVAAAAALAQAGMLALQTWEHRRFTYRRAHTEKSEGRKRRVAVIAPCKGVDTELAENLEALFDQDFPNHDLLFVVESRDDPACPVIQQLIEAHPANSARLVVAGLAVDCGQKIHNLRTGVEALNPEVDVLVFVDSDARPRRDWLLQLTRRLGPFGMQASSSYRWFAGLRNTLANLVLESLDHSLVPLSCPGRGYLVWGGSWAIRRDLYDKVGLHEAWRTAISDDMIAFRVLRQHGVHVEFEPLAIVASPVDVSWRQMFEFVRRQFVIIRWHVPRWWLAGVLMATASQAFFWTSVALAIVLATGGNVWAWLPSGVAGILYAAQIYRAVQRQAAAAEYVPDWHRQAIVPRLFDMFCHPLAAAVNVAALLASGWGRTLAWRGIRYALGRDGTLQIVSRSMPIAPSAESSMQRRAA